MEVSPSRRTQLSSRFFCSHFLLLTLALIALEGGVSVSSDAGVGGSVGGGGGGFESRAAGSSANVPRKPGEETLDVYDEEEFGNSLTLPESEIYVLVPDVDDNQKDEDIVHVLSEDQEDLDTIGRVVYFDSYDSPHADDSYTGARDHVSSQPGSSIRGGAPATLPDVVITQPGDKAPNHPSNISGTGSGSQPADLPGSPGVVVTVSSVTWHHKVTPPLPITRQTRIRIPRLPESTLTRRPHTTALDPKQDKEDHEVGRKKSQSGSMPPQITRQPSSEIAYKSSEPVSVPCEASGDPLPTFSWERNGIALVINGSKIKYAVTSWSTTSSLASGEVSLANGTITITSPDGLDGVFQCFASNNYGKALSTKTTLRKAVLDGFVSKEVVTLTPAVGTPLKLECTPPMSYPPAVIYWGEAAAKLRPIENNERISQDYNGNLYFANVISTDGRRGVKYICLVTNNVIRTLVQGDDKLVVPLSNGTGSPPNLAPQLMWSSPTSIVALVGGQIRMKCIFSGFPTPKVKWTRVSGMVPKDGRMYSPDDSYGQEYVIDKVEVDDKGQYVCSATNTATPSTSAKEFTVNVESMPRWRDGVQPQNVDTSEEEDAILECLADGIPAPRVSWYKNGVPIEDTPADPRRTIASNFIKFVNVTTTDSQVLQCNASNKHGSIFANAYISVRAEPPSFTLSPPPELKLMEGQTVRLSCAGAGAPKPVLDWLKGPEVTGSVRLTTGGRVTLLPSGQLEIMNAEHSDDDVYHCRLTNKFGVYTESTNVIVLDKSVVTVPAMREAAVANYDITLSCDVSVDDQLKTASRVDWLRNDIPLDYDQQRHLRYGSSDHSLRIGSTSVRDTANYTCRVTTEFDSAESSVRVIVKDRPSAPMGVKMTSCTGDTTQVTWLESDSNNDPVLNYSVYYTTSYDLPTANHTELKTDASVRSVLVGLKPWRNYTFYVTSRNSVGTSDWSNITTMGACSTPPAPPTSHPTGVCSQQRGPTQLVIVWKSILESNQNGPGFRYLVSYERNDGELPLQEAGRSGGGVVTVSVVGWDRTELVVDDQEPYKRYVVSVKAVNDKGEAEGPAVSKIVHSGETTPNIRPLNFRLNADSLNSTSVEFLWDAVTEDSNLIRGYFKGYQVKFWKSINSKDVRTVDVIQRPEPDLCPDLDPSVALASSTVERDPSTQHRRRKRHWPRYVRETGPQLQSTGDVVRAYTASLWPYSRVSAGVAVMNGAKDGVGPLSDVIEFDTPEGTPGIVSSPLTLERGSFHLKIGWLPPTEPNGNVTGYTVHYTTDPPGADSSMQPITINGSNNSSTKLLSLKPSTKYIVEISAVTSAGTGHPMIVESSTLAEGPPDKPVIRNMVSGVEFANVSWWPVVTGQQPYNPATSFYVEFKIQDTKHWLQSAREHEHHWLNVTELRPGNTYSIRVVAVNDKEESKSDEQQLPVLSPTDAIRSASAASSIWIIVVLCIIAVIVLIIIIGCFVYRKRNGGAYSVPKKEKEPIKAQDDLLPVPESAAPLQQSAPPTRAAPPVRSARPASLINSMDGTTRGPEGGDSDSLLGEYEEFEESEETKFNEDGSFIGLYGTRRDDVIIGGENGYIASHEDSEERNTIVPKALNTFV